MKKQINRRGFIKTTVVGSATTFLAACDKDPVENLIPFLVPPDDFIPGKSIYFATTCKECPAFCGMVIRTREGRAVKAEGNPHHPFNKGSLCAAGQASLQGLYNPARIRGPYKKQNTDRLDITWDQGLAALAEKILHHKNSGKNQRILYLGRADSGSETSLLSHLLSQIKNAERIVFDLSPLNAMTEAGETVFGKKEIPWYRFDKAKTLVNFGADFMESWLNPVESMRGFSSYYYTFISSRLSLSGSNADKQFICKPGDELSICLAIAHILASQSKLINHVVASQLLKALKSYQPEMVAQKTGINLNTLKQIADRIGFQGNSLIIGGGTTSAGKNQVAMQTALLLVNYLAGNIGKTVLFGTDTSYRHHNLEALSRSIQDMEAGKISMVIFDNVNPVYALPPDSGFRQALKKVPYLVSLSTVADETTEFVNLHLPVSHPLESWGDAKPRKGVYSLQQPVMSNIPGYQTIQRGDLLLKLGKLLNLKGFEYPDFYQYLKQSWIDIHHKSGSFLPFTEFWKTCLQQGGYFKPFSPESVKLNNFWDRFHFKKTNSNDEQIRLLPFNSVFHDVNGYNGDKYWSYEIPDPVSQVVWDSWLEIHPETAKKLGIKNGDLVEISNEKGQKSQVGALLYHGISKNTVGLPTGLGRSLKFPDYTHFKRDLLIPTKKSDPRRLKEITPGFNPLKLIPFELDVQSGDLVFSTTTVKIRSLGTPSDLVSVDGHYGLEKNTQQETGPDRSQKGRNLVKTHTAMPAQDQQTTQHDSSYTSKHHHPKKRHYQSKDTEHQHSFYKKMKTSVKSHPHNLLGVDTPEYYDPYRWEMVIDLDRCTGCSACVAACYAENNIAVVGKERQAVGREMPWLRIERYFSINDTTGELETDFIPQMCAQCENAGCEPVCPLYATYHNPDGINTMIYARCAGTRYCANNCIYKSRRFNWRTYVFPSPLHMQLNPDVTVRDKGVMEKCTFCIQRIKVSKELATKENRLIKDGEIKPACMQSCPTQAITFGNSQAPTSAVSGLKKDKRAYHQLEDYNFKPAVTYLKKIKRS